MKAEVQKVVDEVNSHVGPVEQIKRFEILPHDLSQETGELTPTLKVKRNVVNEKFADVVDADLRRRPASLGVSGQQRPDRHRRAVHRAPPRHGADPLPRARARCPATARQRSTARSPGALLALELAALPEPARARSRSAGCGSARRSST